MTAFDPIQPGAAQGTTTYDDAWVRAEEEVQRERRRRGVSPA